ncbi:pentapeptide repeat-containing protein [Nocardiopsis sp. NPDC058631]|uniref:pentapeptide repeat-containing protein n=1 Tax=Nocardiopsis sp. NPDC058631 TaxID=3346566 RepID=UPI0036648269
MAAAPSPPADTLPWRKRAEQLREHLAKRRSDLSWTAIILGGLGGLVALWPLAVTAWDLLGFTPGQAWRLAALGVCTVLLAAGVAGAKKKRTSPRRLIWLILAAWTVAAGAVTALTALAWLLLGAPNWQQLENLAPKHLDAIATRAFAIVAGLGGVALLVIAYRRQRTTENGEQREVTKLFTDSFDSASDKLGSDHAAVRLAGIHALARLADEAPEGREDLVQMVIDVLCAYLRMPYTPAPEALPKNASKARCEEHRVRELEVASFREVRHTIIRIIGNHLREPTRWRGKDYDFTGAVFDGGNLTGAHFTGGLVSFQDAEFTGGQVLFNEAHFTSGDVDFYEARFTGGQVSFYKAEFTGGRVFFNRGRFTGGLVSFQDAEFTGGQVLFSGARFAGGKVFYLRSRFAGAQVHFDAARFAGGKVGFVDSEFADGTVSYRGTRFTDGQAHFRGAEFKGGRVDFTEAEFTSGQVDFTEAEFTSGQVDFGWGGFAGDLAQFRRDRGACPDGLLEAKVHAMPRTLLIPQAWETPPKHKATAKSTEDPHQEPDMNEPN